MLTSRPLVQAGAVKAAAATAAAAETSPGASASGRTTTCTGSAAATTTGQGLTRPAGFSSFRAAGVHGLFLIWRNQTRHFAARLLMNLANLQDSLLL
jgi:hypothetical protein